MKLTIATALIFLTGFPVHADDKCDALKPTNAQDVDENFKGEIDGEIKGIISRLAGGAAAIKGEYRKLETDKLKDYPDSNKLYVWERILYMACVSPEMKIDINTLFQLYMRGLPDSTSTTRPPIPKTDAPVYGLLKPANYPTPINACSRHGSLDRKTVVIFGDSAFVTQIGSAIPILSIRGCMALTIHDTADGALLSASVNDNSGISPVHIEDNQITAENGDTYSATQSADESTLTVINNHTKQILLGAEYLNKTTIRVIGMFGCPGGPIVPVTYDGTIAGGSLSQVCMMGTGRAGIVVE
jgi:hypothetical protein